MTTKAISFAGFLMFLESIDIAHSRSAAWAEEKLMSTRHVVDQRVKLAGQVTYPICMTGVPQ